MTPVEATLRRAIHVVFGEWSALVMAIENLWGGDNSRGKALALLQKVEEGMCSSPQVYADELEDLLERAMIDDFNIEAEDNSPKQVGEILARLHYEARNGGDETAQMLIARAEARGTKTWVQGELEVKKQESSDDEDLSDVEEGAGEGQMDTEGGGGSGGPKYVAPEVDDDGFQTVAKGSRGRVNRGGR